MHKNKLKYANNVKICIKYDKNDFQKNIVILNNVC